MLVDALHTEHTHTLAVKTGVNWPCLHFRLTRTAAWPRRPKQQIGLVFLRTEIIEYTCGLS